MSHASGEDPYADPVKVREPVERPLDVVIVELLLSASQAFVSGVLMYLAVGLWTDRGVGLGPVAVILGVLSLGVGAAWLFWLLGGTGWPLAAVNVPVAMFAGFALVLGTQGDGLIRLEPIPLLLLVATSVYGLIGGVFLDSPRRWRWDQRRALRPGTKVPRVSPTTMALAAKMPRTLPTRRTGTEPGWPEPPPTDTPPTDDRVMAAGGSVADEPVEPRAEVSLSVPISDEATASVETTPGAPGRGSPRTATDAAAAAAESGSGGAPRDAPPTGVSTKETGPPAAEAPNPPPVDAKGASLRGPDGAIELPTSVEPRPQKSPWAWAAPPEWNRDDEDDDQPGLGPEGKS